MQKMGHLILPKTGHLSVPLTGGAPQQCGPQSPVYPGGVCRLRGGAQLQGVAHGVADSSLRAVADDAFRPFGDALPQLR